MQLSNWVSTQRQEWKSFKLKRQSRLTQERITSLNNVGFVWEAQRGGSRKRKSNERKTAETPTTKTQSNADTCNNKTRTREREIQKICESGSKRPWIAMFKDYLWLSDQKKNPEDIPALKQWANNQREEYKREKIEKGVGNMFVMESSKLTLDQFNLLQSINFDWNLNYIDSSVDDKGKVCPATKSVALINDESKEASQVISYVSSHETDSSSSCGQKQNIHCTRDFPNSAKHQNGTDMAIEVDVAEALFSLGSKP